MKAIWTKLRLPKVSYALHKSDNPLNYASVGSIIYIYNLTVCFENVFNHVWQAYAIG